MKISVSIRAMIVVALLLCVFIVVFNVYDIGTDKTDKSQYTAEEIENLNIEKININTADIQTLCLLPNVGEATAKKIIAYREAYGDFEKVEDIKNVAGIGDKSYLELVVMITV